MNPHWQQKSKEEKAATVWHGAQGLAADVRYYGQWIRDEAEKRLGHLYPKVKITKEMAKDRPDLEQYVGEELTVIAWLWARTVASPNPVALGAHVPLVSSLMVCTKEGKKTWAEICRDPSAPDGWRFHVSTGEISKEKETKAKLGTKAGKAKDFICSITDTPIPRTYIQAEGKADRLAVRLMAVACEGRRGRIYLSPDEQSESIASSANKMPIVEQSRHSFLSGSLPTRAMITGGVCSAYGLRTWGHLFTPRQLVALTTLTDLAQETRERVAKDARMVKFPSDERPVTADAGPVAYADAIATYLAFAVSKAVDYWSSLCSWHSSKELIRNTFGRQALAMVWDFAEANPFQDGTGGFGTSWAEKVLEAWNGSAFGQTQQLDAAASIASVPTPLISTDPPYYDNISYAELSDYFYIWLRRSLVNIYPALFATLLTPKKQELIASAYRHDGNKKSAQSFFEEGLGQAFVRMRDVANVDYPLTVYYAFKQSETGESDDEVDEIAPAVSTGWETMLAGLIRAGFSVDGTWPMRTELGNRMVGSGTNALASSILLVSRPRPASATLATTAVNIMG